MTTTSRQAWDRYFEKKGYLLRSTDLVFPRKDALAAVVDKLQMDDPTHSWDAVETEFRALREKMGDVPQDGNTPTPFSGRNVRHDRDKNKSKRTTFEVAWTNSVALKVNVEEIYVLESDETIPGQPVFQRREVLDDLALWARSLLYVSLGLALAFLFGVALGFYDVLRGWLPLIGTVTIFGLGAYTRKQSNFEAPRILQIVMGALFGNLSAVTSYIAIATVDSNLMCDFANQSTLVAVALYMLACVSGYPAGQAIASRPIDKIDRLVIGIAVFVWVAASIMGFLLPPISCSIVTETTFLHTGILH